MMSSMTVMKPTSCLKTIAYVGLMIGIYYSSLQEMIIQWGTEDYNYCYLIPFVVLYLLWGKKDQLLRQPSISSWWGLLPLGVGLFFYWIGELGGQSYTLLLSFWLAVVGLALFHVGWAKMKIIWFPTIMILAMFPFPDIVNLRLSLGLKLISSQIGVIILDVAGMPAYREGNVIDLGFTQLQVVDACSGLRYLFPLMILALLLAYWFTAHIWKRAFLFVSSIPIAIIMNSFRLAITGLLFPVMGAAAAEYFFHGFAGWLIFMLTIPVLLLEMWVLRRVG